MGRSTCNMVQTIVNMPMEIAANLILESTTGHVHDFKACTEVIQTIVASSSVEMSAMTKEVMEEVILQRRDQVSSAVYYKQSTYLNRIVMK